MRSIGYRLIACVLLGCLIGGCSDGGEAPPRTDSPEVTPRTEIKEVGPLAGLEWPGGPVPSNRLLHDDGRRLWSISLRGERDLIWKHPRANVASLATFPGGKRLALSVSLSPRKAGDPSFVLYLLESDGSIETIDVVDGYRVIDPPIFLRAPTQLRKPAGLYWLRAGENVDSKGRLDTQVMVLGKDGPEEVSVPLRFGEAVFDLHGYPGAGTFSLALFRQNNVPTRLEILKNDDYSQSTDASPTLWGNNEPRANTDVFVGVAWVTPQEYVVPVMKETYPEGYSLRLFRTQCEYLGSHVVYSGTDFDVGFSEAPWPILPGGSDRVLLLGARDMEKIRQGKLDKTPWIAVELPGGEIAQTKAMWEPGAWAWVSPRSPINPGDPVKCNDLEWTWP